MDKMIEVKAEKKIGLIFLGQIINKNGRRPDTGEIRALEYIPALTNTATLHLGMVNAYNLYVLRMHDLRSLLNY